MRPLRRVVRGQLDRLVLQRPLARNSFLCGCLDSTQGESIEHLLVGFGVRKGSTTWISELRHVTGNVGSVSVPNNLIAEVERHLHVGRANEVLIFHNHPHNPINTLFDNLPLPSSQDRKLLLATRYLRPITAFKEALGGGTLRFYLGENGYVREFRTPGILQIIDKLSS